MDACRQGLARGVKKWPIFCGRHKWMTLCTEFSKEQVLPYEYPEIYHFNSPTIQAKFHETAKYIIIYNKMDLLRSFRSLIENKSKA